MSDTQSTTNEDQEAEAEAQLPTPSNDYKRSNDSSDEFTEVFLTLPIELTKVPLESEFERISSFSGARRNDNETDLRHRRSLRGLAAEMTDAQRYELKMKTHEGPDGEDDEADTPTSVKWLTRAELILPNWESHNPCEGPRPTKGVLVLSGEAPLKYGATNAGLTGLIDELKRLISYFERSGSDRSTGDAQWRLKSVEPADGSVAFLYWAISEGGLTKLVQGLARHVQERDSEIADVEELTRTRMLYLASRTKATGDHGVLGVKPRNVGGDFQVGGKSIIRTVRPVSYTKPLLDDSDTQAIATALLIHDEVDSFALAIESLAEDLTDRNAKPKDHTNDNLSDRFGKLQSQFFAFRAESIWPETTHIRDQQALMTAIGKSLNTDKLLETVHDEVNEYAELERSRGQRRIDEGAYKIALYAIFFAVVALVGQLLPEVLKGFGVSPLAEAWTLLGLVVVGFGCLGWLWKR